MRKQSFLFIMAFALIASACEKIIDLEVKEGDKRYILDAELNTMDDSISIILSESVPYLSDDTPTYVENATVELTPEGNSAILVPYESNGRYALPLEALEDQDYKLSVDFNDISVEANSHLTKKTNINELLIDENIEGDLIIRTALSDPAGEDNYYRIRYSIDGQKMDEVENWVLFSDNNNDGGELTPRILNELFESGKKVDVELMTMSKSQYEYYQGMLSISDPSAFSYSVSAPANPVSNWSGDVLGYFSTYAIDTMSVVIP